MTYLLLISALALSGVAAFYAIFGLVAIFAAAPIPIMIMGSLLETSKLVVASWLYRNWKLAPFLLKTYLTIALIILMFLTSMGIFGFLSKAHIEQGTPTGDIVASVVLIEEKIKIEKENVDAARKSITQLDAQINKLTELGNVTRGIQARQQQQKERTALIQQVESGQSTIAKLNQERAAQASTLRKVEAEVGPIKYIAALIYGEEATSDSTLLEKAVRWVTILIVVVFDPLAVLMLIAANWSFVQRQNTQSIPPPQVSRKEPEVEPTPPQSGSGLKFNRSRKTSQSAKVDTHQQNQDHVSDQSLEHPVFKPEDRYWKSRPNKKLT